jgi:hypothetical protein
VADQEGKLELNWVQALASGLAALSSAVLLSTLGATGTVIGAAVGSVVVTVGSAFYSHYLAVSKARVAAAREAARQRAARALSRARSESVLDPPHAAPRIAEAQQELRQAGGRPEASVRWREVARGLRWKPVLLASAAIFVLVMGTIVSLELMTGRALSSYTGGTSVDGPRTSIPLPGGLDRDDEASGRASRGSEDGRSAVTTDGDGQEQTPAEDTADQAPAGDETPLPEADDDDGSTGADSSSDPTPEPTTAPTTEAPEPTPEPTPEPAAEEPVEAPAPEPTSAPAAVDPSLDTGS